MTAPPTYRCAVCGRTVTAESAIYSSHTGNRYCRDLTACHERSDKLKRAAARASKEKA